jgi:hypothetical protein
MPAYFVYPDSNLETEGDGHRMLTVRPTGHDHTRAAFGKTGQSGHDAPEEGKNYPVGLTEN